MDDIFSSLLKITMIALLIRAIISIITGIMVTKRIQKAQQNAAQSDQKLLEERMRQQSEARKADMVKDDYCGKLIEKSKAYIIRSGDQYLHFCSWECRQKYIENRKMASFQMPAEKV